MAELSAVVQLIDGTCGRPAAGTRAEFTLDGRPVQPLPKAQEFYAFADLDRGSHRLEIATREFFPHVATLTVPLVMPLADGIVVCTLEPGPLYPYASTDTLIRGRVMRDGRAVGGADVVARYPGRSGRMVERRTHTWNGGVYDGRYALRLGSAVTATTDITLNASASDGAHAQRVVRVTPATTTIVDLDLD